MSHVRFTQRCVWVQIHPSQIDKYMFRNGYMFTAGQIDIYITDT